MDGQRQDIEQMVAARERCVEDLTYSIRQATECVARRDIAGVDLCTGEQERLYAELKVLCDLLSAVAPGMHLERGKARQLRLAAMTYQKVLVHAGQWLDISMNMLRLLDGGAARIVAPNYQQIC